MGEQNVKTCTAFKENQIVASGNLLKVAGKVKEIIDQDVQASILIFSDVTGEIVEVDFRGTKAEVLERLEKPSAGGESVKSSVDTGRRSQRGPGRPRLGVVSREVTLLPRHWDWLNSQPGSASVTLRKLVEEARRVNSGKDKVRRSQEVTYRFISAMAGNFPRFEETTRALFAGDSERFNSLMSAWPIDIRNHARRLAEAIFQNQT